MDKLEKLILVARETQLRLTRNEVNDTIDKELEEIRRQLAEFEKGESDEQDS